MSIPAQDRPALDTVGHAMFLLLLAAVVTGLYALVGYSAIPFAVTLGLWAGLTGATCFVRGYRDARELDPAPEVDPLRDTLPL